MSDRAFRDRLRRALQGGPARAARPGHPDHAPDGAAPNRPSPRAARAPSNVYLAPSYRTTAPEQEQARPSTPLPGYTPYDATPRARGRRAPQVLIDAARPPDPGAEQAAALAHAHAAFRRLVETYEAWHEEQNAANKIWWDHQQGKWTTLDATQIGEVTAAYNERRRGEREAQDGDLAVLFALDMRLVQTTITLAQLEIIRDEMEARMTEIRLRR